MFKKAARNPWLLYSPFLLYYAYIIKKINGPACMATRFATWTLPKTWYTDITRPARRILICGMAPAIQLS